MPITRMGVSALATLGMGKTTITAFCSTGSVIFIGCSTAAHSATSTFLTEPHAIASFGPIASTMDNTYPTLGSIVASSSGGIVMTFRGTWSTCAAAAKWGEWGIYNATASGTDGILLNRFPDNLGTKSTSATWQLTATLTLTT